MKKNLLFSILFTLFALVSMGNPVDPATARQVASHFWTAVTGSTDGGRWTDVTAQTDYLEFYIFTHNPEPGFVIVAADDRVQPILGYSTSSEVITPLPAHIAAFLQSYNLEIAYCKENGIAATSEITALWNSLIDGEFTPQATTAVPPMLTTNWDQSPRYNNLCPAMGGEHAVTGCAATATAQIMKYWNWPPTGVGSHSYMDYDFGYLSADFGSTIYEWENMPNALSANSSAAQVNAVATLMYHVGVAVEMDYGIDGSGAYVHSYGYPFAASSENALPTYFHYKNTLHSYFRDYTSESDWIEAITTDINAGRPVLETGYGDGGGHAFVIDGYDNTGLFHINWGWGGYMDGYFSQNALNPGTGGTGGNNDFTFNDGKGILVGIEPDGLLEVNPLQLTLPQQGGSDIFTVSPNANSTAPWYAASNQPWLTVTPNNGTASGGSATVTVTATANNSGSIRTATVFVSQGSAQVPVQVTQQADTCIIVDLPWFESFEQGTGCWTVLDADNDGNNWFLATGAANDGSYSMASYSYNPNLGGSLHANNYLITPAIALPAEGNHMMVFHARCGSANFPDTLMVKLTTEAGTSASQFTTTLLPLTPINNTSYQEFSVNLSAFNGQTVKVAIVHKSYDGLFLSVDNIAILNTAATYTITALPTNSAMGYVLGGGSYTAGESATLEAIADNGHRFIGWNDGSTVNPRQVIVTGDATYTASYADLGDSVHHYDNGAWSNILGGSGTLDWGIRFPAGELSEFTTYSGTRFWNYDTGTYTVKLFQGGTETPGSLIASQTYTLNSSGTWYDAMFTTPVTIDHSEPLWITIHNSGTLYPAVGSHYAGNPDGSWISPDGSNWSSAHDYGFNISWMIRALLTGSNTTPYKTLTVNSDDPSMGVVFGGGNFLAGDSTTITATALPGYRFTGWDDGYTENPRTVHISSDSTINAQFANLGDAEKHYDNGAFAGNVGAGGSLHWGVRFPAGTLTGYDLLDGIKMMDIQAGTYELTIYQGGSDAPETQIASQTITTTGASDWQTVNLTTPVSLNHTLPLWIVLYNTGISYPAAGSNYAGNPEGSWVSTDGVSWASVCTYGINRTWMIHANLSNTNPVTFYTITAEAADANQGSVSGGGIYPDGSIVTLTATAAPHHHFTQWNDGITTDTRTITVTNNATYTAHFEIDMHQITVVSEQPDMGYTLGGGNFPYGTEIQIEAVPYTGYEFLRWIGGNTDNPRTVTVTEDKTYHALFQPGVGIGDITMPEVEIYSNGNQIMVDGAAGQSVEIYSIDGKLIATELHSDADHRVFTVSTNGTYLVRTSDGTVKKVTVIR